MDFEKQFVPTTPDVPIIPDVEKKDNQEIETKPETEDEKEIKRTPEEMVGKMDEMFDEMLDAVKNSPEAKQEALKAGMEQIRKIREQMRKIRDIKDLQEIKKIMMKNWEELNELAQGNPELLKSIQEWGNKFADEKIAYYELVEDIKDELIDKSEEIESEWSDVMRDLAKIKPLISDIILHYDHGYKLGRIFNGDILDGSGLKKFIDSIGDMEIGHGEDVDMDSANKFRQSMNDMVDHMYESAYKKGSVVTGKIEDTDKPLQLKTEISSVELHPELEQMMQGVKDRVRLVSGHIKDVSKIYKVIKKMRDTHFLPLYNEQH